jgi:HD-like signal output (HDOD) protein
LRCAARGECSTKTKKTITLMTPSIKPPQRIQKESDTSNPADETYNIGQINEALVREIKNRLHADDLEIPLMPHVVSEIMSLVNRPDVSIRQIEKIIKQDQQIAARVIRMANSPYYRGLHKITSIERAILIIGTRALSDLIFSIFMLSKIFRNRLFDKRMNELWRHSAGCAFICQKLAQKCNSNIDNAFALGLMHDIGKPLIIDTVAKMIRRDPRHYNLEAIQGDTLEQILTEFHGPVGEILARKWSFPQKIIDVILYHHTPIDEKSGAIRQGPLLVAAGNLFCHQFGLAHKCEKFDLINHPWLHALGLDAKAIRELTVELADSSHEFIDSMDSVQTDAKTDAKTEEPVYSPQPKKAKPKPKKAHSKKSTVSKLLKPLKKHFWIWFILFLLFAAAFFLMTGNEIVLPAIYR